MRPRCQARKLPWSGLPGKEGELFPERLLGRLRKVEQQMMSELAPAEFAAVDAHRFSGMGDPLAWSLSTQCGPDLPDTDFPEMEVGRKTRRAHAVGAIPSRRVVGQRLFQESLQLFGGPHFAWTPGCTKTSGPVNRRLKSQFSQLECGGPAARIGDTRGASSGGAGSGFARHAFQNGVNI